jgi:hypothetical protein
MGNLPKELFVRTEKDKALFERVYKIAKRKKWTDEHKEQWSIMVVSDIQTDEEFEKINKLLDTGIKDTSKISFYAFNLKYKRQYPSYVKKYMPDIWVL